MDLYTPSVGRRAAAYGKLGAGRDLQVDLRCALVEPEHLEGERAALAGPEARHVVVTVIGIAESTEVLALRVEVGSRNLGHLGPPSEQNLRSAGRSRRIAVPAGWRGDRQWRRCLRNRWTRRNEQNSRNKEQHHGGERR